MESSTAPDKTPSWLKSDQAGAEVEVPIHHVWKPRPLGRSILWNPVAGLPTEDSPDSYQVFIEQRALELMYRHVWGAVPDVSPFGILLGDLCEDVDSGVPYVLITEAVASTHALAEEEPEQIGVEAIKAMRTHAKRKSRVLAGWYHCHREGPVRLSAQDVGTHRRHFPEPWQVAFLFVTDPQSPVGGCFRPPTRVPEDSDALPFFELASASSLRAGGIFRTRIDWENVETARTVIVEPPPRPTVSAIERPSGPEQSAEPAPPVPAALAEESPLEPEPADEGVPTAPEPEVDRAEAGVSGVAESEAEPVASAHFELLEPTKDAKAEDPDEAITWSLADLGLDLEPGSEAEPREEPALDSDSVAIEHRDTKYLAAPEEYPGESAPPEVLPRSDLKLEYKLIDEPEIELDPEPAPGLPETQREMRTEPEQRSTVGPQPEWVPEPLPALEPETLPEPQPGPGPVESVPGLGPTVGSRMRRWLRDSGVDGIATAVALACILGGARSLSYENAPLEDRPGLSAAVAGLVLPGRADAGTVGRRAQLDPRTSDVLARVSRYRTVSEMYAERRLDCFGLRGAYARVDAGWRDYSIRLMRDRTSDETSASALPEENVFRAVQEVEADFAASGCSRP